MEGIGVRSWILNYVMIQKLPLNPLYGSPRVGIIGCNAPTLGLSDIIHILPLYVVYHQYSTKMISYSHKPIEVDLRNFVVVFYIAISQNTRENCRIILCSPDTAGGCVRGMPRCLRRTHCSPAQPEGNAFDQQPSSLPRASSRPVRRLLVNAALGQEKNESRHH